MPAQVTTIRSVPSPAATSRTASTSAALVTSAGETHPRAEPLGNRRALGRREVKDDDARAGVDQPLGRGQPEPGGTSSELSKES